MFIRKGIKFNGHSINFSKVIVRNKSVQDFINELSPNVERIILHSRMHGNKPFNSKSELKKWLISNQENYNKYIPEVFHFFVEKCKM